MIRVLGVDPGLSHLGVALGVFHPDDGLSVEDVWYIGTKKDSTKKNVRAKADDARRLDEIIKAFDEIVRHNDFDVAAFEECPSIRQNATTTRKVAMAWGAIYALASRRGDRVLYEFSPSTLKYVVTGDKSASKQAMISTLEGRHPVLADYPLAKTKREHVADACAALEVVCAEQAVKGLAVAYGKAQGR